MTFLPENSALSLSQQQALGKVSTLYQPPEIRSPSPACTTLRFGLIADPQYADAPPDLENNRYYRHSLRKLSAAIAELNALPLEFVVTLGDLVDRDWSSYEQLLPLYDELHHPHAALIGNHDAQVISDHLGSQSPALGLPKSYYQFTVPGYRFMVLDGNDVSLYCNHANGDDRQLAEFMLEDLIECQQSQAQSWNGAIGAQQLVWIEQNLQQAKRLGETVIVFGHYPLTPINSHNLWNCETLLELLCEYQVRAYFAGHDHRGGYARIGSTDFITLKGMLDGADSLPFATVELQKGEIMIHGYGTEISRVLPVIGTD
jgi:3',5'-cyclic AMP phosphodiesterase CpdA